MPNASHSTRASLIRRFFIWWVTLMVAAALLAGYWVLRAPYQEWLSLGRVDTLATSLTVAREQLSKLAQEAAAWQSLKAQHGNQLDLMLPSKIDVPNLLTQLEAVARATGFRLDAVSVAETTTGVKQARASSSGVRPVHITMSVSGGGYTKLKELLGAIHRAWRVVQVESFGIGGGEASYRLDLTAFYYPR